jgi:Uma2 family endonuclease
MDAAVRRRKVPADVYTPPLVLRLRPAVELSEDQLFELCQINRDLRIERNAAGELLLMPPAGGGTGDRNSEINMQLRLWAKRDGSGVAFESSTGFRLPNTALRSPDASWVQRSRLEQLSATQYERFLPLCPDFALELRSPSDSLSDAQAKMEEYHANGARLGWLLDPVRRHVYVYRPATPVERLDNPDTVAGDPVLPGFVLDLREIW